MGHRPGTSVSTAARVCVWFVAGVNSVYLGFDKAGWLQQYKIPRTPQQAVSPELFRTCLPRRLCPLLPEQMQHVGGSQSLHVLPGAGAVWPLPRAPLSVRIVVSIMTPWLVNVTLQGVPVCVCTLRRCHTAGSHLQRSGGPVSRGCSDVPHHAALWYVGVHAIQLLSWLVWLVRLVWLGVLGRLNSLQTRGGMYS